MNDIVPHIGSTHPAHARHTQAVLGGAVASRTLFFQRPLRLSQMLLVYLSIPESSEPLAEYLKIGSAR